MTDQGVSIVVNSAAVVGAVNRAIALGADPVEINRQISDYLKQTVDERFEAQAGPGGTPWAKLRPRTIAERTRKGYVPVSILTRRGVLKSQVVPFYDARQAGTGSNNPYARIHQLGGEITVGERVQTIYRRYDAKNDELSARFVSRKRSNFAQDVKVKSHKITIPRRPYLGFDAADEAACIAIAERAALAAIGGGA